MMFISVWLVLIVCIIFTILGVLTLNDVVTGVSISILIFVTPFTYEFTKYYIRYRTIPPLRLILTTRIGKNVEEIVIKYE